MLKTVLKINLNQNQKLYYISGLLAVGASAFIVLSSSAPNLYQTRDSRTLEPQVLGESTEKIRGEEQNETIPLPQISALRGIKFEQISAKAFAVADEQSQTILLAKNPEEKLPIASLTKLMTALLAYEKLDPNEYYVISADDALSVSPSLGLMPGGQIKIINLLESSLVCSANDSAKALANAVQKQSKQNFTELMNAKAQALNLSETRFSNPLGFDSDSNYSSASDLLKLTAYTQSLAVFKNLGKRTVISFASKAGRLFSCKATNKLVGKNLEIENIKTGYTEQAKGSIIARVSRGGKTLIVVVVGSQSREQDLLKLSELAFENFEWGR